jgi:hypothetical protein
MIISREVSFRLNICTDIVISNQLNERIRQKDLSTQEYKNLFLQNQIVFTYPATIIWLKVKKT